VVSARRYVPTARLADRVAAIVVVENAPGEVQVLPTASAVMGVQFRGRIHAEQGVLSQAGVTGIQSTVRQFTHPEATSSILVRFTAQGAASLGAPPGEVLNRSVSLEDMLGRGRISELCERVCEARDDRARVEIVEQFLLERPFVNDALVARATSLLAQAEALSVAETAEALGVSERQFERRFRNRVGVSPKQFARLARFERAVSVAKLELPAATGRGGDAPELPPSLATIAQVAGYYDQSHLVRDVREFARTTPKLLFLGPR
jgi:AraC-like DNA-binding protein